jgi:hypothetical protein
MDVPAAVRAADAGSGESTMDERGEARPEGPHPDADHADAEEVEEAIPELGEEESDSWDIYGWLSETPEGSYRDMDARDFWDPDGGGRNRLAFHLSDLTGARGIPNGVGLVIGAAEMYYNLAQHDGESGGDEGGDGEFPDIQESAV